MSNNSYMRVFERLMLILAFLSFSGCATAPVKIETLNIETSISNKIPLKIGLFRFLIPPQFQGV